MRTIRPALIGLLIGASALVTAAPGFAQTCACPPGEGLASGPFIQTDEPPPPLPVYEQPSMPAPGYVWTPGYWAWNNYDYYWVPGVWAPPPRPGVFWTPGYWAFVGGAYLFRPGYWAPHVGYYGGVNYGYGYNGLGYQGGRWEGERFAYNTNVNNFGSVRVTNVYTEPVMVPPGAGRASYNGGPGGVVLRPTPEQERLTTEERLRPTPMQVTQARTASMQAMQFRSANQGKPAVAATARPGELTGPGAMPAKAAGSAEAPPAPGQNGPPEPNGAQRFAPGAKPPAGAPALDHRLPSGSALPPVGGPAPQRPNPSQAPIQAAPSPASPPLGGPAAQRPSPGQTPIKAAPPNGPKAQPAPPPGAPKPPAAAEKPNRIEAPPAPAPQRPQGAERPTPQNAAPALQRELRPEPPRGMERPSGPPTPRIEPGGANGPHGQRPEPQPGRPERKGGECGVPGAPPCR